MSRGEYIDYSYAYESKERCSLSIYVLAHYPYPVMSNLWIITVGLPIAATSSTLGRYSSLCVVVIRVWQSWYHARRREDKYKKARRRATSNCIGEKKKEKVEECDGRYRSI